MDNNTEQLKVLAEVFNTDKIITSDQIEQVLTGILGLLVRFKKENESLNNDTKTQVESILESIYKEHDRILKSVENSTQNVKSEATESITKAISEMKRMCAEVMEMKPKDGEKGEDADEEKIIEEVLAKIKLPEYKEVVLDDGSEIIAKINDEKVAKINASQIEGLPTFEGKVNGGGWRNLNQLHDVNLSNLANNDVLKYNSTTELWENGVGGGGATAFTSLTDVPSSYTGAGGKVVAVNVGETGLEFISASGVGTVTSVAATVPTGLTISGSPVTTSGTLAIGLDTGYVIPLQTTLDGKASTGAVTGTGITMSTARILGRTTAATGAIEELTAGSSLSLSAGSLDTIQDIRTTANPQFATIELGAATDTTLSRVSAGVIAVEGVTVATASNTLTLSGKTLTEPKFVDGGFIADANGNEMIIFDTVASAVNEITLANAATGANPKLSATGGDTNIGIDLQTKGTGVVNILGNSTQAGEVRIFEDTDNGTNYTGFKAPATLAGNVVYTLPTADGSSGQFLSTNGSGTLSWATGGSSSFSGAKAYRTTDVSLTASTWATIDLDNETYDTDSYHDNSTNPSRITIPATGKYRFTANTELTSNKTHGVRLLKNGTAIEGASGTYANSGLTEGAPVSWEDSFTSGDYVQMQVVTANTATSCTFAALSVQRLE